MTDNNVEQLEVNKEQEQLCCEKIEEVSNKENVEGKNDEILDNKKRYEVVFFVDYYLSQRPKLEDIVKYFSKYGNVDHVNCPVGRNFAIVFMSSLNTKEEVRRTWAVMKQIINEMTPENQFYITVSRKRRVRQGILQRDNERQERQKSSDYRGGYRKDEGRILRVNERRFSREDLMRLRRGNNKK